MKISYLLIICACPFTTRAQSICDSLRAAYNQQRAGKIGLMTWETPPRLLADPHTITVEQPPGSLDCEVFVDFFITADGRAECLLAHTLNTNLRDAALARVRELKFVPARVQQRYVPAMMILRLTVVTKQL